MQNYNSKFKINIKTRSKEDIQALLNEATEIANMLAAGVIKLKQKSF